VTATTALDDTVLVAAVDLARGVLLEQVDAADVGERLASITEGDHVVTHYFDCLRAGYRGWKWSVSIARAEGSDAVTVDEVVLLPGDDAIVAPQWVPYKDRLRPGDLSPGDLLPVEDDDPRLVPTYSFGDDPLDADAKAQIRQVANDLGLGRVRTLSPEGLDLAAQRWWDGDGGPDVALAQSAPAKCTSCGFLLRLAGSLSETFGVCANGNANDDGRVVALGHGCGAHSEAQLSKKQQPLPPADHAHDTLSRDIESL
jgi:hypothetical protein